MSRPLRMGFIGDGSVLTPVAEALRRHQIEFTLEPVTVDGPGAPDVEVLIAIAADLDVTPQYVTQRAHAWGNIPLIVLLPRLKLDCIRRWTTLGVLECVTTSEIERWIVLAEYIRQGRRATLSSYLLQTVIDAVPVPIYFKDEQGIYLGCNTAFEQALGLSRSDLIGMTTFDISPPELAETYSKADLALLESGRTQVFETRVKCADGKLHDVIFHKAIFTKSDGNPGGLVGAVMDITERKALEERLQRLATIDPLTGVNNRRQFFKLSEAEQARCHRENRPLALLLLDIDYFKRVNDSYGHAAGDEVLIALTELVGDLLRKHDILGRAGGEEFFVTLGNTSLGDAETIAERLRERIENLSIDHNGTRIQVTVSIGVVEWGQDESMETALQRADIAMYQAKRAGRNRVVSQSATSANAATG